MKDIVERLRDIDPHPPLSFHADLRREAADEIERLRKALREVLSDYNGYNLLEAEKDRDPLMWASMRRAEEALGDD